MTRVAAAIVLLLALGCAPSPPVDPSADEVSRLLDRWHEAAGAADEQGYFGPFAADGVFLGTDAGERWTVEEFRLYAKPHFSKGQGWTYVPRERHVSFSEDGRLAWFDEKLGNEKYGELRGTGVLRYEDAAWKLVHYSMSFPIPNDLTRDVVALIRGASAEAP